MDIFVHVQDIYINVCTCVHVHAQKQEQILLVQLSYIVRAYTHFTIYR